MAQQTYIEKLTVKFLRAANQQGSGNLRGLGGILLGGDPGIGKEQPLYSKILTPSGWTTMGEIAVGDEVVTPSGEITTVSGVYPQGKKDIYTITFHDGSKAECGIDHLWKCFYPPYSTKPCKEDVLSTRQLIELKQKMDKKGYNANISIPIIVPHDKPDVELDIDPYLLGVLVGDGTLGKNIIITSADQHILNSVSEKLPPNLELCEHTKSKSWNQLDYRIRHKKETERGKHSIKEMLDHYGLTHCRSWEKFIPQEYLNSSPSQRLSLLQGLMDTDGTVTKQGRCSYTTTSERLAYQFQELVWSLGGVASMSTRRSSYSYQGENKTGRKAYTIQVVFPDMSNVFTLERKKERCRKHTDGRVELRRRIQSIELTGFEEAQCIRVTHPDHLYITDGYIVTHNTTFLELFSDLTGIHLITIEVPHIVEEHIINIPFLVYNPQTEGTQTGRSEMHDKNPGNNDEYDMVLADSHLFSQIKSAHSMSDQQYVARMTDPNPNSNRQRIAQQLYQRLGGTAEQIPPVIQKVRRSFRCILFFDEYFRETPIRIRNILRDTINGNIGIHKIPSGTFIVYASNMKDDGLETIPHNTQMAKRIEFKAPTANEWFQWMETKYTNDPKVQLKPEVISVFKKIITDENISQNDSKSEVRTSPRRWEQIILYVNQGLPVEDREDAVAMLTNIKNNFVNYETGEFSEVVNSVIKGVTYLIKTLDNIDIGEGETTSGVDWTRNLSHHLAQHMKSGNHRKYIPVVSGRPGVGKTSQIDRLADKFNLICIPIDTSRLNPEDVVGMPIPGKRSEDKQKMNVKFTVPQLYDQIRREIETETRAHFEDLKEEIGEQEAAKEFEEWKNQEWKYLVFFDELNRVDKKTFNSLRRIILEKNFGPSSDEGGGVLKLPDGSVVVGAINPDPGTGGTESMTGHFRDVIDIIQATPSWAKTRKYLLNKPNKGLSEASISAAMTVLDEFVKKFSDKSGTYDQDQAPYFIRAGEGEAVWVSPREYDAMFVSLASTYEDIKDSVVGDANMDVEEAKEMVADETADNLEEGLLFPIEKTDMVAPEEFLSLLRQWADTISGKIYSSLISKSVNFEETWTGVLDRYFTGARPVTEMPDDSKINNAMENSNAAQFVEDVAAAFAHAMKNDDTFKKLIKAEVSPIKYQNEEMSEDTSAEKTHRLGAVVMGLLYTLRIHEYQFDRIMAIGKALTRGAQQALKGLSLNQQERADAIEALSDLRADVQDALAYIKYDD